MLGRDRAGTRRRNAAHFTHDEKDHNRKSRTFQPNAHSRWEAGLCKVQVGRNVSNFIASWQRVWEGLGAVGDGTALAGALVARYSEPWRKYHTLQHLNECLAQFASVAHLAKHPAEVEAALWFHDAVYELRAGDNEEQSALWAKAALLEADVLSPAAERVARLVLATKHTAVPTHPDEQLLVDIDLSILGATVRRFQEYEDQVRAEYSFVPEPTFRIKRAEILQTFLARPRIYSTDFFHAKLEASARINLANSLAAIAI